MSAGGVYVSASPKIASVGHTPAAPVSGSASASPRQPSGTRIIP